MLQIGFCQQYDDDSVGTSANEFMLQSSHENLAKVFDSSERDDWQKPDEVIEFLGEIKDKTIVDVGSGSGYFSFRLVKAGANVIAADIDSEFLQIIEKKQKELNIDQDELKTVRIDENKLNIDTRSADIVFLVNAYHHISDRVNYFSSVNSTLKEDGKIVIVDFYKKTLPVGPPKNHKISKEVVLKELKEAGYEKVEINTELLEYQYIITAYKF
jgi:ubiquinone/menaquinone biosynthesis C-methylase UbiE